MYVVRLCGYTVEEAWRKSAGGSISGFIKSRNYPPLALYFIILEGQQQQLDDLRTTLVRKLRLVVDGNTISTKSFV